MTKGRTMIGGREKKRGVSLDKLMRRLSKTTSGGASSKKSYARSVAVRPHVDASYMVRNLCLVHGLPKPVEEYAFADGRKWRFDAAWVDARLAVEVHGGTRSGGRHVRGDGYRKDREKMNAAVLLGWRVLEFTTEEMRENETGVAAMIGHALGIESWSKRAMEGIGVQESHPEDRG